MNAFRLVFLIMSLSAIGGVSYVSWTGAVGQSFDVKQQSVRTGSGGIGRVGRVK